MAGWEQSMDSERRRFEEDLERRLQRMERDAERGRKILETEFKAVNPWKPEPKLKHELEHEHVGY